MKYIFQVGDRGTTSWNLGVEYGGRKITVIEGLKDRIWRSDGKPYPSYAIEYDDGERLEIKAQFVELPKPTRGDLDKKAGWGMLPVAVAVAMREGPSNENV